MYFTEFGWTFLFAEISHLLCLVFIQSYRIQFVSKGFEIMDMAIPLNLHIQDLRKCDTLFYTNIFLEKS